MFITLQLASRASGSGDWDPFVVRSSSPIASSSTAVVPTTPPQVRHDPPSVIDATTRTLEDTGVYETEDHALRGFICPSPASPNSPRPRTQIDLCLPLVRAFHKPGDVILHCVLFIGLTKPYRRAQHVLAANTRSGLTSMASSLFGDSPTGSTLGLLEAIKDTRPDDRSRSLGMLQ